MSETPSEAVRRIASLARLEVREDEAAALAAQFERILGQFQVLARLDVAQVEEEGSPIRPGEQRRADEPRPGFTPAQALGNAPARIDDFYRVPKTVGGAE